VVETDVAGCCGAIPVDGLMQAVEERVGDQFLFRLWRVMVSAGSMEGGSVRRSVADTPQGGVISLAGTATRWTEPEQATSAASN
jgi:RNA-directed DNA polymerase